MKVVYVVMVDTGECLEIDSIWTSKTKAEQRAEKAAESCCGETEYLPRVDEWEVSK